MKTFYISIVIYLLSIVQGLTKEIDINLPQIFLLDDRTGTILYAKNEDKSFQPASLAKLMTAKVIFDALKDQKISLEQKFPVSQHAWRTGGAPSRTTTMFAALNSEITVQNLLYGLTILNANDAAIILAEGYAKTEENFVTLMNEKAKELGLFDTSFVNATGLPADGQKTTLRDILHLMQIISRSDPDFYAYYKNDFFTWNKIKQRNKNKIAGLDFDIEASINSYVEDIGYGFVGAITDGDRHLFLALNGIKDKKKQKFYIEKIFKWGLENFTIKSLFNTHDKIGEAAVFGGAAKKVTLRLKKPLQILVPKDENPFLTAKLTYKGPLIAPIKANTCPAKIQIYSKRKIFLEQEVCTQENVKKAGLFKHAKDSFYEFSLGWLRRYFYFL